MTNGGAFRSPFGHRSNVFLIGPFSSASNLFLFHKRGLIPFGDKEEIPSPTFA
jgi:hypothetical protein